MTGRYINMDDADSLFFDRELEHIKTRTYDIKYPEYKARTLIPVSFEAGPGAESITYRQYREAGLAKLISNYGDDLPRSDTWVTEYTHSIKSLGASYGWNIQEIRAARMANKPLEQRRANAARRALLKKENELAFFGDKITGLNGLLNHIDIPKIEFKKGKNGSLKWADKTPDEILEDLHSLATKISEKTKGIESPNTLLLPLEHYNYIFNKRLDKTNTTIGKWFLETSPHIKNIDWLNELKGCGPNKEDMLIAYDRNPEKLTLEIPVDFQTLAPQERNLEIVVSCYQRYGGVIIYYPLSLIEAYGF
jgi:hypothetical protein